MHLTCFLLFRLPWGQPVVVRTKQPPFPAVLTLMTRQCFIFKPWHRPNLSEVYQMTVDHTVILSMIIDIILLLIAILIYLFWHTYSLCWLYELAIIRKIKANKGWVVSSFFQLFLSFLFLNNNVFNNHQTQGEYIFLARLEVNKNPFSASAQDHNLLTDNSSQMSKMKYQKLQHKSMPINSLQNM